jgi:protein TonB
VLRGVAGPLDQEAIRVVKTMPKWMPGRQNGKPVDVRYRLPIMFQLD